MRKHYRLERQPWSNLNLTWWLHSDLTLASCLWVWFLFFLGSSSAVLAGIFYRNVEERTENCKSSVGIQQGMNKPALSPECECNHTAHKLFTNHSHRHNFSLILLLFLSMRSVPLFPFYRQGTKDSENLYSLSTQLSGSFKEGRWPCRCSLKLCRVLLHRDVWTMAKESKMLLFCLDPNTQVCVDPWH